MRIILDDVIVQRQKFGGILTWWGLISNRIKKSSNVSSITSHGYFWFLPKIKKCDVFLSSYLTINLYPGCKNYFVIHDILREKYTNNLMTKCYKLYIKFAIRTCYKIITISEKVKDEIHDYYHVPKSKIIVIKHGINFSRKDFFKRPKAPSNKYLIVGNRKSYKNFKDSISKLQNQNIIIAGAATTSEEKELLRRYNIKSKEYIYPSNDILKTLYLNTEYLFWPSLDEGFGIPLLEAINLGCLPLVYSNKINREILGEFLLLIDDIPDINPIYSRKMYWDYFSKEFSLDRMINEYLNLLKIEKNL
jgi:mannosyltransferase